MSDYTESDYHNIHSHVGKLKRSAIDSYMRWNYPDFDHMEDEYVYKPVDSTPPFDKPIEPEADEPKPCGPLQAALDRPAETRATTPRHPASSGGPRIRW